MRETMKYAFLICDGAADWPIADLGNKTIFEAANIPHMDWVAQHGQMGLLKTVPDACKDKPGSECANMSILGYNPETDLTGRGPLEALSSGVDMSSTDISFRCNVITIEEGLIKDYSSGHITTEESLPLIQDLQDKLASPGVDFFPGIQYRHILRMDGNKFSEDIDLTPPHDQLDKPYQKFLARPLDEHDEKAKKTANFINELIEKSHPILMGHDINKKRMAEGKRMATHIWPWSGGKKPEIIPFKKKYGLTGSVISAVDLIFGLGVAAGLEPIHVEGATGLPDTNYEGKVEAALGELEKKDFVYVHLEAVDEMGHAGDIKRKVSALEDFDSRVVKPFLDARESFSNELVIVILPDHATPIEIRTHSPEPIPFAIFHPRHKNSQPGERKYSEKSGKEGEYGLIESGEDFVNMIVNL